MLLRTAAGADLLILDDLGSEFNSGFLISTLYSLLNNRLGAKLPPSSPPTSPTALCWKSSTPKRSPAASPLLSPSSLWATIFGRRRQKKRKFTHFICKKHLLTAFAVSRCFSISLCSVSIQTLSRRVHTPEFQRFFRCNFRAVLIEGDWHLSGTLKLCQLFFRKCQFFFQSGCHIIRIYHNKAPFQSWLPVGLRSVASRLFSHHFPLHESFLCRQRTKYHLPAR